MEVAAPALEGLRADDVAVALARRAAGAPDRFLRLAAGAQLGGRPGDGAGEAALKSAGKRFEAYRYPGTQHGFHNDTTPRFDAAAAGQAWQRTVAFFNRTLRGQ